MPKLDGDKKSFIRRRLKEERTTLRKRLKRVKAALKFLEENEGSGDLLDLINEGRPHYHG